LIGCMIRFDQMRQWPRPAVIAHRGAGHFGRGRTTVENTLEAFAFAIAVGADGIELDLRRTADGVIIVFHDANLPSIRRSVGKTPYCDLDHHCRKLGYHVPTLDEMLAVCAGRIALDIELKEEGYEDEVVVSVRRYYELETIAFTSFHDTCLTAVRKAAPGAITGLLIGWKPFAAKGKLRRHGLSKRLAACGCRFVGPDRRLVDLSFGRMVKRAGVPFIAWTVNDEKAVTRLINSGVSAIITDVPEKILPLVTDGPRLAAR
jgi:glycerophosphoryl diester phosphodiesterase